MKKTIQILCIFSVFLVLNAGCSGQNKDELKPKAVTQIVTADSIEKSDGSALSDTTLVTFIELGSVKCIPCKMMQPIMEEIEKEYAGQVKVVFHDVWTKEGKPQAEKWEISAIPTQIFLDKESNEYFRHTGFFPKEELVDVLKKQGVK